MLEISEPKMLICFACPLDVRRLLEELCQANRCAALKGEKEIDNFDNNAGARLE